MTPAPRIRRALPEGTVITPDDGIPVTVTLVFHGGFTEEVDALAVAWTPQAVEIEWTGAWGLRRDWVAAQDVRRRT